MAGGTVEPVFAEEGQKMHKQLITAYALRRQNSPMGKPLLTRKREALRYLREWNKVSWSSGLTLVEVKVSPRDIITAKYPLGLRFLRPHTITVSKFYWDGKTIK